MPTFLIPVIIIFFSLFIITFFYTIYSMKKGMRPRKYQYKDLCIEIKNSLKSVQLIVNDELKDEVIGVNVPSIQLTAEVNDYKVKVNIAGGNLGKVHFVLFINEEKIAEDF